MKISPRHLAASVLALALAACSQAADEPTDTAEQSIDSAGEAAPAPARRGHRAHGDPAKLIEKLDKDGNGTLELTELPEHKQRWLGGADADKDGKLTAEELTAHRAKMHEQRFAEMDSDKDGFLTEQELGERRWRRLGRADTDGDGKVSMAELRTAHEQGTLRGFRGHRGHRGFWKKDPAKLFEKLDLDENGTLELSELPEHKREKLGAADADKDGKLTADELRTHFEARAKEHGARSGECHAKDEQSL